MSALQKKVLTAKVPRGLPPRPFGSRGGRGGGGRGGRGGRVYTPLHWSKYFKNRKSITIEKSIFNVYTGGDENVGPLLVFLHGGGYSGLTWSLLNEEITRLVNCQTLAIDLRGHGCSQTENEEDLSSQTMASDISNVVKYHVESLDSIPEIVLVGHSMGGALAVHTALEGEIDALIGLVVIDVVEGTAMDALSSMQSFLRGRPKTFHSIEYAIEWSLRSAQVRNGESARVSMPGQLRNATTNECAANEIKEETETSIESTSKPTARLPLEDEHAIQEEDEDDDEASKEPKEKQFKSPEEPELKTSSYAWRIDLGQTEPHWTGWFTGLSSKFLSVPATKMLVLAGVDRLDRDLTVGQMQGKFQMQVLPQAGHAVHEDVPEKLAEILAAFLVRNKFATAKDAFAATFPAC
eukprot:12035.XXX_661160_662383_1 [CDS] Oithona nana genome sequencing.